MSETTMADESLSHLECTPLAEDGTLESSPLHILLTPLELVCVINDAAEG